MLHKNSMAPPLSTPGAVQMEAEPHNYSAISCAL